jgi:hypothetical protein
VDELTRYRSLFLSPLEGAVQTQHLDSERLLELLSDAMSSGWDAIALGTEVATVVVRKGQTSPAFALGVLRRLAQDAPAPEPRRPLEDHQVDAVACGNEACDGYGWHNYTVQRYGIDYVEARRCPIHPLTWRAREGSGVIDDSPVRVAAVRDSSPSPQPARWADGIRRELRERECRG